MSFLAANWPFLVPIIIIQLVLQIAATRHLVRATAVRGDSKVVWGIVIWLFQAPGPVIYFLAGRKEPVS